jgi:aminoglycoside phosphotransferase (APT) family kinase protein
MSGTRMHADELPIDEALVRRLLGQQFPRWADLDLLRVRSAGTDHALFRLGDEFAVRLPRRPCAATQIEKEQRWLPRLAPHVPVAVPVPVAKGAPSKGYPWAWSVVRWLPGEDGLVARGIDGLRAAEDLAEFVRSLRSLDSEGGPPPGAHNFGRGQPLAAEDAETRAAIAQMSDTHDVRVLTNAWEEVLAVPAWACRPVWVHGDLLPGNLLFREGRLSAVLDWGGLGVGDPACDLIPAWSLVSGSARDAFRAAVGLDDATWARGRGWALSIALIAWPYYRDSNPPFAALAERMLAEVLTERAAGCD